MTIRRAYKGFTHDLRPPIQRGDPVWDGRLPFTLPTVRLDDSSADCGAGWNACATAEGVLSIAGLWPNGHSLRLFEVEGDFIERGKKLRSSSLTLLRELPEAEIEKGIRKFSASFAPFTEEMAVAQMDWRRALLSTIYDVNKVEEGLRLALAKRGLPWTLKRFGDARDARAARDAWDAWDARAARAAWDAWDARAARDAWDAWDARASLAQESLTWRFATLQKWISGDPDVYTIGILDACANGLAFAIPTGPNELGWAMKSA